MVLAVMVMVMVLVMLGEVVVVTEEHWLAGNLESAELLVLLGKPEIEFMIRWDNIGIWDFCFSPKVSWPLVQDYQSLAMQIISISSG